MDIKTEITKIVTKLTEDKELLAKFREDPKAAVTSLVSDAVSAEALNAIIEGVKTKINIDNAGDMVDAVKSKLASGDAGDLADKAKDMLGGLLGKK